MTDEQRDDEMLGRALARAVETQEVNETAFDASRLARRTASRPASGLWQLAGVAAALLLAVAFASWFTRPQDVGPAAASAAGTWKTVAPATSTPSATNTPAPTVTPKAPPAYAFAPSLDAISDDGGGRGVTPNATWSVDSVANDLARFVLTFEGGNAKVPAYTVTPRYSATPASTDGAATITVSVPAVANNAVTFTTLVGHPPLRTVISGSGRGDQPLWVYTLVLDDLRPWRVFTLTNPARLVVDIGGVPQATSDRITVYAPAPGATISRTFAVSGAARVFEANVVWRVKDSTQKIVASGHTTASLGTSAVWGTFDTQITLPSSVTGNVTLEVYEVSPKDGSEQGLVAISLVVR